MNHPDCRDTEAAAGRSDEQRRDAQRLQREQREEVNKG